MTEYDPLKPESLKGQTITRVWSDLGYLFIQTNQGEVLQIVYDKVYDGCGTLLDYSDTPDMNN